MTQTLPVLILAYQRPDSVMEICRTCSTAGIKSIYVSIDGPSCASMAEEQARLVTMLHDFSEQHGAINMKIKHAGFNQGLVKAVLNGIDWVFESEERTIILEEDLHPNVDFFHFCETGLNTYEDDLRVLSISGNNFTPSGKNIVHASSYPLIWGWAIWKNRWQTARPFLDGPKVMSSWNPHITRNAGFWNAGLIRVRFSKLNSWALPFAAYSIKYRFLNLLPPTNLVGNFGFDEFATHTLDTSNNVYSFNLDLPPQTVFPVSVNDFEFLDSQIRKTFYHIRFRHLLSPIFALMEVILIKFKRGTTCEK